jgi:hypothetical protein
MAGTDMNELQKPDSSPDTEPDSAPGAGTSNQLDTPAREQDPVTWVGLVWRIVRDAIESNEKLIRVCILICLVGAALWFIASFR